MTGNKVKKYTFEFVFPKGWCWNHVCDGTWTALSQTSFKTLTRSEARPPPLAPHGLMSASGCRDLGLPGSFSLDPTLHSLPSLAAHTRLRPGHPYSCAFPRPRRVLTLSGESLARTQDLYVSVMLMVSVLLSWFWMLRAWAMHKQEKPHCSKTLEEGIFLSFFLF